MATTKLPSAYAQRSSSAVQYSVSAKPTTRSLEAGKTHDASSLLAMKSVRAPSPSPARSINDDRKVIKRMPSFLPRAKNSGGLKTAAVAQASGDGGLVGVPTNCSEAGEDKKITDDTDPVTVDRASIHDEGDDTITDLFPITPLTHR